MDNALLKPQIASDIDQMVSRVLNDLGNPSPPLQLGAVREILKLDRSYYDQTDPGLFQIFIHKLTMAGKQLIKEPTRLIDAIGKWDLKALYLPDIRKILIDTDLPTIKQRWAEAHEIGHSFIPWHHVLMMGDSKLSLRPVCHAALEAEANYAAGRLLFLNSQFDEQIDSSELTIKTIRSLASNFGNSITSLQ